MTQQEQIYKIASELATSKRAVDIKRAMDLFESIPEYEDATECVKACKARLDKIAKENQFKPKRVRMNYLPIIFIVLAFLVCIIGTLIASYLLGDHKKDPVYMDLPTATMVPTPVLPTVTPTLSATPISTATPIPTATPTTVATPTPMPTETPIPTETPSPFPTYAPVEADSIHDVPLQDPSSVEIGEIIRFGAYEQDNVNNGLETIEWIVLDVQDGKALLLSRYGLDAMLFYPTFDENITWETCTIRSWLNQDFFNTAFSEEQQNAILTTLVQTEEYVTYDFSRFRYEACNDTWDKLFLLSASEVAKYLPTEESRQLLPTRYAVEGRNGHFNKGTQHSAWLIRNGIDLNAANPDESPLCGSISSVGMFSAETPQDLTRPAMWVSLADLK